MDTGKKTKILYISEVPIELSYAGATLLYRLFETYPPDKLFVIQGMQINPKARLKNVKYICLENKYINRIINSRLSLLGKILSLLLNRILLFLLRRKIALFAPDVVITVSHREMWILAKEVSERIRKPLYIIAHDEWGICENYGMLQSYFESQFQTSLTYAKEIFCICPNMQEFYAQKFSVKSKILYPSVGVNDKQYDIVNQNKNNENKVKFCYAGSLDTSDFLKMLNEFAKLLAKYNGELYIYSNIKEQALSSYSHLKKNHVHLYGMLPPDKLMKQMNDCIDVAIVLNSFENSQAFMYNLSSKTVDYLSAGLPILFWGAPSSGLISWVASLNYQAIVLSMNLKELEDVTTSFFSLEARIKYAEELKELSLNHFSHSRNYNTLLSSMHESN